MWFLHIWRHDPCCDPPRKHTYFHRGLTSKALASRPTVSSSQNRLFKDNFSASYSLPFQRQASELSPVLLQVRIRWGEHGERVHLLAAGFVGDAQVLQPAALRRRRSGVLRQHRDGDPQPGNDNNKIMHLWSTFSCWKDLLKWSF